MKVGIDIDGVIGNFFQPYERLVVKLTGRDLFGPNKWPKALPQCWDWPQSFGYTDEEIKWCWKYIKSHPEFWKSEPHLPGMNDVKQINVVKHDIYYITNRPGQGAQNVSHDWLTVHGIYDPNVIVVERKGPICAALGLDVYIDDKYENVIDCQKESPSTRTYMPDYPYNRQGPVERRVESVYEVLRKEGLLG